jgi:hypothetical protein
MGSNHQHGALFGSGLVTSITQVPNGNYQQRTFRIARLPVGQHQLLISRAVRPSLGFLWRAAATRLARSIHARPPRQSALHHWPLLPVLDPVPTAKWHHNLRLIMSQTGGVAMR